MLPVKFERKHDSRYLDMNIAPISSKCLKFNMFAACLCCNFFKVLHFYLVATGTHTRAHIRVVHTNVGGIAEYLCISMTDESVPSECSSLVDNMRWYLHLTSCTAQLCQLQSAHTHTRTAAFRVGGYVCRFTCVCRAFRL